MTPHELGQARKLHPDVVDLAGMIETAFGKPVDIRIDPSMKVPAVVKAARERMPAHLIVIHPSQSDVLSYLVASRCASIERIMRVPAADRRVPVSTPEQIEQAMASLAPEIALLPEHVRRARPARLWVEGLVSQLASLPVQARIEEWVSRIVPAVGKEQRRYLERDIAVTVQGLSDEVLRMTAPSIFRASNSMTYAFVRRVGEFLGEELSEPYREFPEIVEVGTELYDVFDDVPEGYAGDMEIVDRWAERLGISGWFEWRGFEEMPGEYFEF